MRPRCAWYGQDDVDRREDLNRRSTSDFRLSRAVIEQQLPLRALHFERTRITRAAQFDKGKWIPSRPEVHAEFSRARSQQGEDRMRADSAKPIRCIPGVRFLAMENAMPERSLRSLDRLRKMVRLVHAGEV